MSFTSDIRTELCTLPIKALCCRRAFLYGLLYGASIEKDTVTVTLPAPRENAFDLPAHAASLIHTLFSRTADATHLTRGAHRYVRLSFSYKVAARAMAALISLPEEEAAAETLTDKLGFHCEGCVDHFLRGLFVAYGSVNDPTKGSHLEIKLPGDGRVEPLHILLSECGYVPGRVRRGEAVGLVFKSSSDIQEVLAHFGVTSRIFDLYNAQIEREIRNYENRATNCVTENIARSVRSGIRQTTAITALQDMGLLPSLPDDLQTTALLRLENPSVSLAGLAALHDPPLTKSGLNHRLAKITAFYESTQKTQGETALPHSSQKEGDA